MGAQCLGKCDNYPGVRHATKGGRRLEGEKKCTVCEMAIKTDEIRCPCCNMMLRGRIHGKKFE